MKLGFLFLSLISLSTAQSFASPIDFTEEDLYSRDDLVEDCTSSIGGETPTDAHKETCERALKGITKVEIPAYELCMDKKNDDGKFTMERFTACVQITNNKAFKRDALDVCQLSETVKDQQDCFKGIADGSFSPDAVDYCINSFEKNPKVAADCVIAVKDRSLSAAVAKTCDSKSGSAKIACLGRLGTPRPSVGSSDNECRQQLSDIEARISQLSAVNKDLQLKTQLGEIINAIQRANNKTNSAE